MTNNFSMIFKKYLVPLLFFVAGLLILVIGIRDEQDTHFLLASVLMFSAGLISILYSSGKLKPVIVYAIGGITGLVAIFALYLSWNSVAETTRMQTLVKETTLIAKQNLEDIRYVQKAYADKHGVYLKDWDAFVDYVKNGTMDYIDARGTVPSRKIEPAERDYLYGDNRPIDELMTEQEAYRLSKWTEGPKYSEFQDFKRDTIQKSIMELKFRNKAYVENREANGLYAFTPDSLPYIPQTGATEMWELQTKDSVNLGDRVSPSIFVTGFLPFIDSQGRREMEMGFGNIDSDDTGGTWEEE